MDLLLKTLYVQGARTGQQLVETISLPFPFVDDQLLTLQQRRLRRGPGHQRRQPRRLHVRPHRRRPDRAREALVSSQYVGPARCRWRSTAAGWSGRRSARRT